MLDAKPVFDMCARCEVPYCSRDCQKEDWCVGGHRLRCCPIKTEPNRRKSSSIRYEALLMGADDTVSRRDAAFVQMLAKTEFERHRASVVARYGRSVCSWRVDLRHYPHTISPAAESSHGCETALAVYLTKENDERKVGVVLRSHDFKPARKTSSRPRPPSFDDRQHPLDATCDEIDEIVSRVRDECRDSSFGPYDRKTLVSALVKVVPDVYRSQKKRTNERSCFVAVLIVLWKLSFVVCLSLLFLFTVILWILIFARNAVPEMVLAVRWRRYVYYRIFFFSTLITFIAEYLRDMSYAS